MFKAKVPSHRFVESNGIKMVGVFYAKNEVARSSVYDISGQKIKKSS